MGVDKIKITEGAPENGVKIDSILKDDCSVAQAENAQILK